MIRYCIIDDEPIAHRIIDGYCAELSHLKKVGSAFNAFEASTMVLQQKPDLIFLDINMPKMTGFEWLKTLNNPPRIIVTTAYKEFAIEGYELDILDYLLKPFSFARFMKAVNKVDQKANEINTTTSQSSENKQFFIKGDKKHHQINTNDILFIEAYGNYSKVYLTDEMILTHEKISMLEELLMEDSFLRVHKSFLIAKNKIDFIQGNQIYIKEHKVPIGQTYRSKIHKLVGGK